MTSNFIDKCRYCSKELKHQTENEKGYYIYMELPDITLGKTTFHVCRIHVDCFRKMAGKEAMKILFPHSK